MKLKKNVWPLVEQAASERINELKRLFDDGDIVNFVNVAQCGLLTYEDLVEPSKLSLEDEFWSLCSPEEIENSRHDLAEILEYISADRMSAAMESAAASLATNKISQQTVRAIFNLIEDFLNNKEAYDA